MQNNPYVPSKAGLSETPKPAASPLKSVLLGLVVDVGGSFLLGIVLSVGYAISLASAGMSESKIMEAMLNPFSNPLILVVGTLGGAALSVAGGFVCARLSRRPDYRLGFILGGISAVSGLLMSYESYSLPVNLLLTLLTFASVLLGTKLGRNTEPRSEEPK